MPNKKLVIIDGYSLLFRAFFGTRYLSTSDGRPTNALFGFVSMLYNILEKVRPDSLLIAFDAPGKTFRSEAYEEYKGTRSETPNELRFQLSTSRQLISALGIPQLELAGFEADDVIGTVTARAEANGYESVIVTGDLDSLQLVDDHVTVMTTRTGVTDVVNYDVAAVFERYGFGPELLPDYKALVGDTSDNIPGVPGVGPKTASKLIADFGTVENIIERKEEIEEKVLKKLRPCLEQIPISKWLATIDRNIPIEFTFEPFKVTKSQADEAQKMLESLEFRMHSKRMPLVLGPYLVGAQQSLFSETTAVIVAEKPKLLVSDAADIAEVLSWIGERKAAVYADATGAAAAIGLEVRTLQTDIFRELVSSHARDLTFHDAKPHLRELCVAVRPRFDAHLAAYVLQSGRSNYLVEDLAIGYLDELAPETPAEKASAVSRLEDPLTDRLNLESQWSVYERIELAILPILAQMEIDGVRVDCDMLADFAKSLAVQIGQIESTVFGLAGEEFNIGSPMQLGKILFEKLGIPASKKTKTGYATGVEVLQQLGAEYEICREILNWRELSKLKNTYADSLPKCVADDGRIHTTYLQHIAATGRLSSTDPNLQNIPIRTDLGREIRRAFIPADRFALASLDYSQIELRLLAHYCQEPALVEAFESGTDVHAVTASLMWGENVSEVSRAHRRYSKMLNYAVLYGVTDFGLANQLGGEFSVKEAREMINQYFVRFPKVRAYIDSTLEEARSKGYTTTLTGRRRYFPDIHAGNRVARHYAERQAMNAPLQGGSADMIKLAMIKIQPLLADKQTRMILQVHDELLFELADDEHDLLPALKEAMETALPLDVPIEVDAAIGPNWLETKTG